MAEISKANILGIIGLLGAILMIIGVFLSWADLTILNHTTSYDGLKVFGDEMFDGIEYRYAPIVALAGGIIALLTTILPIVLHKPAINRILGIVSLILAIVTIIMVILFNGQMDTASFEGFVLAGVSTGIGAWLSLAGAAILAIGGIIDIANKYKTE